MSELKRNQSLFRQLAPAARAPCRGAPAMSPPPRLATEPEELCMVEPWEGTAGQGGDPYNGMGSRAILRRPATASTALPVRK